MGEPLIDVVVLDGFGLVWRAADAKRLRLEHRIIGTMVGTLPGFRAQNAVLGLPLLLCPEEVEVARRRGAVRLLGEPMPAELLSAAMAEEDPAEAALTAAHRKQEDEFAEFYAGISSDGDSDNELKRTQGDRDLCSVKLPLAWASRLQATEKVFFELDRARPTDSRRLAGVPLQSAAWTFPATRGDSRRLAVFADLHARGYTLTSGIKFGGDYLAYPGDPILYHAQFVVRVLAPEEALPPRGLAAAARVAHAARKHLLLATVSAGDLPPSFLSVAPETMFGRAL